jgi:hypothetical protein
MARVKYIKTKDNTIIVFSMAFHHSSFSGFYPISAGFISIGADERHKPTCECYGESITLKLKSDPEDSELARRQILGYDY